ncbi:putative short chain dehydrogenase reductase family [Zalerion maritima]|uniref:Short chain dehydrogenase reductase family n=1 Tax=Zalerion maritima TaxID=339359 RepID=A0AAD5RGI0_9PEZI|nr:putative short chain dehydrogenase reductase family [Zalerion maritima]
MPLYQPPDVNAPVLSQFSLKGKVACVTGGAKGIGVEIVRGLAEAGADVAFIYSTSKNADEVAAKIAEETGVRIQAYQSDVSSRHRIAETLNQIADEFGKGRLDIMVANSGVCANIPSLDYTERDWKHNNGVNLDGVMWTAQAAGKIFKKQGKGNLIVTASVSAILVNIPQNQVAYNASKAAVVHLAKSLAVEWTEFARVNCISPGFVQTEMLDFQPKELRDQWMNTIPGRRICQPAELKSAYVFLASDACCYMTGANIVIDGGYTLP